MKKFLILILILLLPVVVRAGGLLMLGGQTPTAGGGGISDDFSGDLSKWIADCETGYYSISSNQLVQATSSGLVSLRYSAASVGSINQWVKVQVVGVPNASNERIGLMLRNTGTANDAKYVVGIYHTGAALQHMWESAVNCALTFEDNAALAAFNSGDWYGAMIKEQGVNTVIYTWRWTSDPGDGPWSIGGASVTYIDNPVNAADTGQYVGVYGLGSGLILDNFSAGSWTP